MTRNRYGRDIGFCTSFKVFAVYGEMCTMKNFGYRMRHVDNSVGPNLVIIRRLAWGWIERFMHGKVVTNNQADH